MANTPDEIFRIHTRHLATPGKKYYRDDGTVFRGTDTRRLKIIEEAENTSFDPGQNFDSNTTQGAIDELDTELNELTETVEENYNTLVNLISEDNNTDKCFAIAMSIALG